MKQAAQFKQKDAPGKSGRPKYARDKAEGQRQSPQERGPQKQGPQKQTAQRQGAQHQNAQHQNAQQRTGNPAVKKTLDRLLSKSGTASRTEARHWIAQGRVKVDGRIATSPEEWVEPERQHITVDGKPLRAPKHVYLLFYKPKGYLTTHKDPEGRPTIFDLLRELRSRVTYVGRLDLDTSGLLILTNDHAFSDYISNPESHVAKTYLVKSAPLLSDEQLERLRQGVELEDGSTRPAVVNRLRDGPKHSFFEITITEGRNRQVRRMVETVGGRVLKLVRTRIGSIAIDGLEIGKYRELEPGELESLKRASAGSPARGPSSKRSAEASPGSDGNDSGE